MPSNLKFEPRIQIEIENEVNLQKGETKPSDNHELIAAADGLVFDCDGTSVSYTHLTLPTIYSV